MRGVIVIEEGDQAVADGALPAEVVVRATEFGVVYRIAFCAEDVAHAAARLQRGEAARMRHRRVFQAADVQPEAEWEARAAAISLDQGCLLGFTHSAPVV